MKIGINFILWATRLDFKKNESVIRQIKKWGFDGVELPVSAVNQKDYEKFKILCEELQLAVATNAALDGNECNPFSDDKNLRDKAVDELKEAIDNTIALGGNILAGPLYQIVGSFSGKIPTEKEWTRAVEVIRKVGEYASKVKVKIALEPLNRFESYLFNTLSDGYKFVKDVGLDNIGLLADTYHSNIEEKNVNESWKKVINKIYHVHISENDRGIPGTGHAIPKEIFETLTAAGYDDWIVVEGFNNKVPEIVSVMHIWRSVTPTFEEIAVNGIKFIKEMLLQTNSAKH